MFQGGGHSTARRVGNHHQELALPRPLRRAGHSEVNRGNYQERTDFSSADSPNEGRAGPLPSEEGTISNVKDLCPRTKDEFARHGQNLALTVSLALFAIQVRCRANSEQISKSRPDFSLGFNHVCVAVAVWSAPSRWTKNFSSRGNFPLCN